MKRHGEFALKAAMFIGACVGAVFASLAGQWPLLGLFVAIAFGCLALSFLPVFKSQAETQRERAEGLQIQFERQQRAIDGFADGLDVAVLICDPQSLILYANRRARAMFEFPDPIGRTILAVTLTHTIEKMVQRAVQGHGAQTDELSLRSGEMNAIVRVWPEPSVGDRLFITLFDVTTLRRLERVRKDFVANVSHELRTPMASIRAMAEILTDVTPDEADLRERYLQQIMREVDRLTLIVNDLLILSTAESQEVEREDCDLAALVREVSESLSPKAAERGLQLQVDLPDRLDARVNPGQISQVALNLIDNAINYTPEGTVNVRLTREENDALLEVVDSGIGMASEHLPRIFERFYRVDKGRSRNRGGTGLGLSIVKHIVEAHGGRVSAESMLNQGSTFTVILPLCRHQSAPEPLKIEVSNTRVEG